MFYKYLKSIRPTVTGKTFQSFGPYELFLFLRERFFSTHFMRIRILRAGSSKSQFLNLSWDNSIRYLITSLFLIGVPLEALDLDSLNWSSNSSMSELRNHLKNCHVVLEAGTRHAEHSIWFSSVWEGVEVYTFEANPDYFTTIYANIHKYPNIHFYPFGLAEFSGEYDFYVSQYAFGANSLLASTREREGFYQDKKIKTYCVNLDEWFSEMDISHIDLIWFDLEGSELSIFKGAPTVLKNTSMIYTEVNFEEFRLGMTQFEELYNFLLQNGFDLLVICGDRNEQADAIFIKTPMQLHQP